jgi:hypothetical protein
MKLQLPKWFTTPKAEKPGAPALITSELVAQLEQRLTEANGEVDAAQAKTQELLVRFSESRTSENLEAQEAAESDVARLQKLRSLVVADLETARVKLAAEERAALEKLEVELKSQRSDRSRDEALVNELVQALEQVITIQAKRYELCLVNSNLDSQIHGIRLKLGHASDYRWDQLDYQPSSHSVVEKLNASIRHDDAFQTRNRLTGVLANLLTHWR